ncbi:DMT family transporter [Schauerella aestuarii]|uniref:DMT family transporter n=1 Tax=Schauerella aestuarii TaxID=2511204 RepID=UPI00136C8EE2|nr:DMT family transporter [Achromobacter aestuarii]MYZ43331.1 EamA family transporter [Achromobacter aestuarii]
MLSYAGGLVLVAALLHASWNAMLHANNDRSLSMAWMSIAIAVVATVVIFFTPAPAPAAWPYIAASGIVHILYNLALVRSYRTYDLAQAYPIARGSSPLFVTLGATLVAQETIGPLHVLGIAMISSGILAIALEGRKLSSSGAVAALLTGVTIAVYTVLDGMGVRLTHGDAIAYTAWMFLCYWVMPVLFIAKSGVGALWTPVRRAPRSIGISLIGGVVSLLAYGIVIWALQSGAMGAVSALRETSVVFAVLIGRLFLGEALTVRRSIACLVVAIGAFCLGL